MLFIPGTSKDDIKTEPGFSGENDHSISERLKVELDKIKKDHQDLKPKLNECLEENNSLKRKRKALEPIRCEISNWEKEYYDAKADNERLNMELEKTKTEKVKLKARVIKGLKEIQALKRKSSQQELEWLSSVKKREIAFQKDKEILELDLATCKQHRNMLEKEQQVIIRNMEQAKAKRDELQTLVEKHRREIECLQGRCENMKKLQKEKDNLEVEFEKQKTKIEWLEDGYESISKSEDEKDSLKAQVKQQNMEKCKLQVDIEQCKKEMQYLKERNEKMDELEAERDTLQEKLEELKEEAEERLMESDSYCDCDIAYMKLEEKNEDLQEEVEQLREENKSLEEDRYDYDDLRNKKVSLEEQVEEQARDIGRLERRHRRQIGTLNFEIKNLREKIRRLKKNISNIRRSMIMARSE